MFEQMSRDSRLFADLTKPAELLQDIFLNNMGARIGHSTVVSQKMHTVNPAKPQEVMIMQKVDAGQVFYQRQNQGEVFHLDIFHACGMVDHRRVAAAIRRAVEIYNFHYSVSHVVLFRTRPSRVQADMIDIQTGTGGGRVTGSLNFGQKLSLRRAHENHVHVAVMLPHEQAACLFYIVMAVEGVIRETQLELRRNEQIIHINESGGGRSDLSPYSDQTDSYLREKNTANMSETVKRHQYTQDVSELADDFDSVQELKEFLDEVEDDGNEKKLTQSLLRKGAGENTLSRLSSMGIVQGEGKNVSLTDYGQELKSYLERNLPDMEAHIRRTFRLMRPAVMRPGRSKILKEATGGGQGHRLLTPVDWQDSLGELAIPETVNFAARRSVSEGAAGLAISGEDLQQFIRQKKQKLDMCLLIDASASMNGKRLRAAKFLARHLLFSTPDRIAVITFQENTAKVQTPFTRDYREVEEGLRQINAFGSTPLALGLKTCAGYLSEVKANNSLVILITDGIPTVAEQSRDPMADAIDAAEEIKKYGYGFSCIGLKPHRTYLNQLAEAAGGTIYVLEELEKQALVKTAWQERAGRYC